MHSAFKVNVLTEERLDDMREIAELFNDLYETLRAKCADGRELSLVKTKLEEACFYAKKCRV